MFTIEGKYTTATIMIDQVDDNCMEQIIKMINHEAFTNPVAIMPDCHSGKGSVIGFTSEITNKIIPNVVGVDLGCFTGDTKIPLLNGMQYEIKSLVGVGEFYIYSIDDETGKIVPGKATAVKTKESAQLMEIVISCGEKIRCTPEQKFMLTNGEYKEAQKLQPKDSLMPLYRFYESRDGYERVQSYKQFSRYTHDLVAEFFLGKIPKEHNTHHKDNLWFNNVPSNLEYLTKNEHARTHAITNNYFATDDFNYMTNYREEFLEKMKNNGHHINTIENLKKMNEINNNILLTCEKCNRQVKGALGFFRHYESCGIPKEYINCEFCGKKLINNKSSITNHKKRFCNITNSNHKVLLIKKLDYKEDVYCLQVEKYHNFALSAGVFVHNCGMLSFNVGKININHEDLDKKIREKIPFGFNINKKGKVRLDQEVMWLCKKIGVEFDYVVKSIGSLGSGNHFCEIGRSQNTDDIWVTIHSGSRNLGARVCDYWQDRASKKELSNPKSLINDIKETYPKEEWQKRITELKAKIKSIKPSELDFLEGEDKTGYLNDMEYCQQYASINRNAMMTDILTILEYPEPKERIETIHNYINFQDHIIRKGAISSYIGVKMIIPFNMRDGILICEGKSNPEWNFSAPHGSGRVLSRSKAKETLNVEDFKKTMEGIYSNSVSFESLDESPMAYKDSKVIEEAIKDTAIVLDRIIPIHNMKDTTIEKPWKKKKNGSEQITEIEGE